MSVCPDGSYSSVGSVSCDPCAGGHYCVNGVKGLCEAGTSAVVGSNSCSGCPLGTFSSNGYPVCLPCQTGTFASAEGSAECTKCPPGTYASSMGSVACIQCPAGKYASSSATTCYSCPTGTYSGKGYAQCTNCPSGTYAASHPLDPLHVLIALLARMPTQQGIRHAHNVQMDSLLHPGLLGALSAHMESTAMGTLGTSVLTVPQASMRA